MQSNTRDKGGVGGGVVRQGCRYHFSNIYLFVSLSQIAPFDLGMNLTLRGTGELETPRQKRNNNNNNTIFIER